METNSAYGNIQRPLRKAAVGLLAVISLGAATLAATSPSASAQNGDSNREQTEEATVDLIDRIGVDTLELDPADDLARKSLSNAGRFVDYDSGTVVYQFTEHDPARDSAILAALPAEVKNVRIDTVEFSLRDLARAKAQLVPRLGEGDLQGVGIDVTNNGLYLLTAGDTTAERVNTSVQLRDELGMDVPLTVEHGLNSDDACNSRAACGGSNARRGGVRVQNSSNASCTSGLNVSYNGTNYNMTAGHCWYGQNSGTITSGGQSFGSLNSTNFLYHNSWCDCRLIATGSATTLGYFYRADFDKYQDISSAPNTVEVGDQVKLYGQYNQSLSSVSQLDYTYTSSTCSCTIMNSALAGYVDQPGDSGGTIASATGTSAYGIHSGGSGGYSRFFEVRNLGWTGASVLT